MSDPNLPAGCTQRQIDDAADAGVCVECGEELCDCGAGMETEREREERIADEIAEDKADERKLWK